MYTPRSYRNRMNRERFREFRVVVGESDLWIGISPPAFKASIVKATEHFLVTLRTVLQGYILSHPEFRDSFDPIPIGDDDPETIRRMKEASLAAGTGPMAAVAGMVAEETGRFLKEKSDPDELVIENGGDIYLQVTKPLTLSIDAGRNKRFSSLGLVIPPEYTPAGICTSSGMFGHSVSLGRADCVTVVCTSAYDSDAFATSVANRINKAGDIDETLGTAYRKQMLGLVCIKDDRIGIRGKLRLAHLD